VARHPVSDVGAVLRTAAADERRRAAASSVDEFAGADKKRGRRSVSRTDVRRMVGEARKMAQDLDHVKVTPSLIVALYYLCHQEVYGAEPVELVGESWRDACLAVGRLIKQEFDGEARAVVEFVRWVWRRERWRESRRHEGERKWRVTWRQQFVRRDLLSDYRTEQSRARTAAARSAGATTAAR